MTLVWCRVEPIQNSAVTFLMYSFSFSVGVRLRNCLTANVLASALRRINRTEPPAPLPMKRPKNSNYISVLVTPSSIVTKAIEKKQNAQLTPLAITTFNISIERIAKANITCPWSNRHSSRWILLTQLLLFMVRQLVVRFRLLITAFEEALELVEHRLLLFKMMEMGMVIMMIIFGFLEDELRGCGGSLRWDDTTSSTYVRSSSLITTWSRRCTRHRYWRISRHGRGFRLWNTSGSISTSSWRQRCRSVGSIGRILYLVLRRGNSRTFIVRRWPRWKWCTLVVISLRTEVGTSWYTVIWSDGFKLLSDS